MAALAVVGAELKFRDGQSKKIVVKVEKSLSSLINGINDVNANVSQLLSELVEQENGQGACAVGKEEEDDGEDDDENDPQNLEHQPPAKKSRT